VRWEPVDYETVISCEALDTLLGNPDLAVVDCRFNLRAPEQGREDYRTLHIPGAVYVHLEEDLSGPIVAGRTGRHPLPSPEELAGTLSRLGIDHTVQVVAYDASGGAIAARFWWMLRWVGHRRVAVLDGGWQAWRAAGFPVKRDTEHRTRRSFPLALKPETVVNADDVLRVRDDGEWRVLDARSADRFRGENETLDPVAGHIPGAVSAPYADNLDADGRFQTAEALKARYEGALGGVRPEQVVIYCGSGVTAAHNLLALEYAGLAGARLYAGSWSDWITDPSRPVARG
jgi:thiosulfate/3-mercaptopyruvate sulfurtransferase